VSLQPLGQIADDRIAELRRERARSPRRASGRRPPRGGHLWTRARDLAGTGLVRLGERVRVHPSARLGHPASVTR